MEIQGAAGTVALTKKDGKWKQLAADAVEGGFRLWKKGAFKPPGV